MTPRNEVIKSIQYLRGIAAVVVIISHALDYAIAADNLPIVTFIGRLGVILFFVLSGFIMVAVTGKSSFRPSDFLYRRALRILPLYWVVTTAVAIACQAAPRAFQTTMFTWDHYLLSMLFFPHADPQDASSFFPLVKLGWTLNYEVFFYLLFASLAYASSKVRVLGISGILLTLVAVGLVLGPSSLLARFFTGIELLGFVFGMLIALVRQQMPTAMTSARAAFGAGGLGMVILAGDAVLAVLAGDVTWIHKALISIGAALVVAGALAIESQRGMPNWRSLRFLGDASYSIYLVHLFGIGFASVLMIRLGETGIPFFLAFLTTLAAGLVTGVLTYIFVEAPLTSAAKRQFDVSFGPLKRRRQAP